MAMPGRLTVKLSIVALTAALVALGGERTTVANSAKIFKCTSRFCTGDNGCSGDLYERMGCSMYCFDIIGGAEINKTGYADCPPLME